MDAHSANALMRLKRARPGFLDHLRHAPLFSVVGVEHSLRTARLSDQIIAELSITRTRQPVINLRVRRLSALSQSRDKSSIIVPQSRSLVGFSCLKRKLRWYRLCVRIRSSERRMPMDRDAFRGNWDHFKGEVKNKWGQFTDDDLLETEGDYDKFMELVRKRYQDQEEELKCWTDDWYSKQERDEIIRRRSTESRNQT